MNRSCTSLRICYLGVPALTLVAVLLRCIALFRCFDASIGYFKSGVLSIMCDVLCVAAAVLPFVCAVIMSKADMPALKAHMQPVVAKPHAAGIIPAAVMATAAVMFFVLYRNPGAGTQYSSPKLLIWMFATGLFAAVFFAARCGLKIGTSATVLLGFVVIAWTILAVGYTYFDLYTTMNSPIKVALQFGLLAAMLTVTSEIRALLGRYAPRSGLFFTCLAVFFGFYASVPTLVAHFAVARQTTVHFLIACTLLAVAIYETVRFVNLVLCYDGREDSAIESTDNESPAVESDDAPSAGGES
jgi:hypothetical protein